MGTLPGRCPSLAMVGALSTLTQVKPSTSHRCFTDAGDNRRKQTMSLKRIRLELARTPDFPHGSALHGYECVAPLDDKCHLHTVDWPRLKGACTVRRFWDKTDDEHGAL